MKMRPLRDRRLVERIDGDEKTRGEIFPIAQPTGLAQGDTI